MASIQEAKAAERMRQEVRRVFAKGSGVELVPFPQRSGEVPDRPVLTFAVLAPDQVGDDPNETARMIESMTREHGAFARTSKSALIWCVSDAAHAIRNEARKVIAWEVTGDGEDNLRLDDGQSRQLTESLRRARRDLKESV